MKQLSLYLCFCLLCVSSPAQIPDKAMITTSGNAIVYAEPDEVIINIQIYNEGKNLEEARQASNSTARSVISFCKQMKIEEKHVQTDYLNITTNQRRYNMENQQIIFTASQNISVCLKDLGMYEKLMEGLIARGVYGVGSSQFRTTEMRKYKDMARVKAINAAKEKAELLASELQRKVGAAHYINEVKANPWASPLARNAYANTIGDMGGDGASESTIAPGQLVITAEVEVTFILE